MSRFVRSTALLLLLLLPAGAFALEVPDKPTAWVTDRAGIIPADTEQRINEKLESFYKRSGSQFLVFTFPSLEGESLEDFTMRVGDRWKVNEDRALILFVFPEDRKVRVEVGYGLEGSITDAMASRVIRETIVPAFRRGEYAAGIEGALDQMIGIVEGTEAPIPPEQAEDRPLGLADFIPLIFIALIFLFVIGPLLRRGGCIGCFPIFPGGGGTTMGGGGWGGGRGGGGGGWSVGGGWGGGGSSFGGGGASGSW